MAVEEKEIVKTGDYVMIKKEAVVPTGYPKTARDGGFPLLVHGVLPDGFHVYTRDISVIEYASNPFIIGKELVLKITPEENAKTQ